MSTLAEDVEMLRQDYAAAVRAFNEAKALIHEHNAKVERVKAKHLVPPGFTIDYHRDGRIKPEAECAYVPGEG